MTRRTAIRKLTNCTSVQSAASSVPVPGAPPEGLGPAQLPLPSPLGRAWVQHDLRGVPLGLGTACWRLAPQAGRQSRGSLGKVLEGHPEPYLSHLSLAGRGRATLETLPSTRRHLWVTPVPSTLPGDPQSALGTELPATEGSGPATVGHTGVVAHVQTTPGHFRPPRGAIGGEGR